MKKTIITIETFQRTTIRSRQGAKTARCERCAAEAPSKAAAQSQQAVKEIFRLAETGETDYSETEIPGLLVCVD